MKYYKDENNNVYAYESDGSQDAFISKNFIAILEEEAKTITKPILTQEQILKNYEDKIQSRLDDFAKERGYNDILSACTYSTSKIIKFQIEGQQCVDLRDKTWDEVYKIILAVKDSGYLPSWNELEEQLPKLTWAELR